jgi:predicted TIM-barrel fold metal-dependent hydrolase
MWPGPRRPLPAADARANVLASQFIFDAQTHFVRDDFSEKGLTALSIYAANNWNADLKGKDDLSRFKFENYLKEVFVDSDTKVALLSGAPSDTTSWIALSNEQIAYTKNMINRIAGSKRMLAHSLISPKAYTWPNDVDFAIDNFKPDSWKGYTIGDPLTPSTKGSYWRLDDEKLVYRNFYEKITKTQDTSTIVCIHKGLLPADFETLWPVIWQHATVDDLGKAAKDWPGITFVIYHSALRPFLETPDAALAEFEKTGRIKWATDLAEIPAKYGVLNVYAEVGTAFANSAVANPRFAAALMGTLIRGLGADHVIWGTDSVWYGSPQWQIEAMRRLEIPEDMQKQHGFAPLGAADGLVKSAIFGGNSTRLYKLTFNTALGSIPTDRIAAIKADYLAGGGLRSNTRYGYVCPPGGRLA